MQATNQLIRVKKERFRALKKFRNYSLGAKITLILFFLFFVFEAVIHLYPFLWVINNSLKSADQYNYGGSTMELTNTWAFSNYGKVFSEFVVNGTVTYGQMLFNSVWQTFEYLLVNLLASMFIAYALAKFRFPGKGFLFGLLIFTQTIPIIGTGAAAYKLRDAMGLINNPYMFWIVWMSGFDYSAFVMYGTFKGISDSYMESAELDGANQFQILFKIIFPLIFPCVLALMVTNFITRWNDYTTSQINLNQYPSLAYGMFLYQTASSWSAGGKVVYYASLIMAAIPGIILYSCFQGFIIKNVSVGGIKG